MQSIDPMLFDLYQRGVSIVAHDGQLHIRAAKGTLLPEELDELRTLKHEILDRLQQIELTSKAPLRAQTTEDPAPLTAVQKLMWNTFLAAGARPSKRTCIDAMHVSGELNYLTLQRCLDAVIDRHSALRTRIVVIDGTPLQEVQQSQGCDLRMVNLSATRDSATPYHVMNQIRARAKQAIDLSTDALFEATLYRLSTSEHVFVIALSHLIADGMSMAILSREIWSLYSQASRALPMSLPPLPLQFSDYAHWQRRIQSAWVFEHQPYWRRRLAGASRAIIPTIQPREDTADPCVDLQIPFGNELTQKLREMANREGTLLSLVVLSIYAAVISRWCGHDDLLVSFVVDGRHDPALQGMIGDLAYHLHLRLEVSDTDRWIDFLGRVKSEYSAASDHQDFGFAALLIPECMDTFDNLDVYFNWMTVDDSWLHDFREPHGLRLGKFQLSSNFPTKFLPYFVDTEDGIVAVLRHCPDRFAPGSIEQFGDNLLLYARQLVEQPLSALPS